MARYMPWYRRAYLIYRLARRLRYGRYEAMTMALNDLRQS